MLLRSQYTLAEPWEDGSGILINTFSGAIDIVSGESVDFVNSTHCASNEDTPLSWEFLLERGYYVESRDVERAFAKQYTALKRPQVRETRVPKYIISLTQRCNLACDYCWQVIERRTARQQTNLIDTERVAHIFDFIRKDKEPFEDGVPVISIFGGEPLIDTPEHFAIIDFIATQAQDANCSLHFTTNGRSLGAYEAVLRAAQASVQVTVDGFSEQGGSPVLSRANQPLPELYETIAKLVQSGDVTLHLRYLTNGANAQGFRSLVDRVHADFNADDKFVLAVAPIQDKAGDGQGHFSSKVEILDEVLSVLKRHPYAPRVSFMDWRGLYALNSLKYGAQQMGAPLFHYCEANANLLCFDQDGKIYACYEGIGNPEYEVGSYWPHASIDHDHLSAYRDRTGFTVEGCADCALSPVCGGGCQVRGRKANGGYEHPFCNDLHDEMRYVLRNWKALHSALVEGGVGHG